MLHVWDSSRNLLIAVYSCLWRKQVNNNLLNKDRDYECWLLIDISAQHYMFLLFYSLIQSLHSCVFHSFFMQSRAAALKKVIFCS